MGTSAYAAPEQLCKGGKVDEKTDIYSLGIVLWELYTKTGTEMERVEGISSLRQGKHEVTDAAEEVQRGLGDLMRMLTSSEPEKDQARQTCLKSNSLKKIFVSWTREEKQKL